jgi:hypothetical protein
LIIREEIHPIRGEEIRPRLCEENRLIPGEKIRPICCRISA